MEKLEIMSIIITIAEG